MNWILVAMFSVALLITLVMSLGGMIWYRFKLNNPLPDDSDYWKRARANREAKRLAKLAPKPVTPAPAAPAAAKKAEEPKKEEKKPEKKDDKKKKPFSFGDFIGKVASFFLKSAFALLIGVVAVKIFIAYSKDMIGVSEHFAEMRANMSEGYDSFVTVNTTEWSEPVEIPFGHTAKWKLNVHGCVLHVLVNDTDIHTQPPIEDPTWAPVQRQDAFRLRFMLEPTADPNWPPADAKVGYRIR